MLAKSTIDQQNEIQSQVSLSREEFMLKIERKMQEQHLANEQHLALLHTSFDTF